MRDPSGSSGLLIFRYLNREVLRAFVGVLAVLVAIFLTQRLVQRLGQAAGGDISGVAVLQLVGLYVPVLFSLLLPLTLFLSILLAFGRLYVEHEMTVLRACGVGERDVIRHLMKPVAALTLFTAAMTMWVVPTALESETRVLDAQAAQGQLSLLLPGRFQETSDKKSVFYVQEFTGEDALAGVFFATLPQEAAGGSQASPADGTPGEKTGIMAAKSGYHYTDPADGQHYLVLTDGYRYELTPGRNDWSVVRYDKYFMRVPDPEINARQRKTKALSTLQLLQNRTPANVAELQWRLSVPLSMPILALMAVPLCRVRPREGKFARLLPGLMIYLLYTLLLMLARSRVEDGKLPEWIGLWPVHLVALGIAVFLVTRREVRRAPAELRPATPDGAAS